MVKFFYADCVITDVEIETQTKVQLIVTARIDGREFKKLSMSEEMYRYFRGVGKGTQNRIWLYQVGRSKITFIAAVENAAGERLERVAITKDMKFYDFWIRPACMGVVFWFAAWVILFIPVMFVMQGKPQESSEIINPIGIYGGIALALWYSHGVRNRYKKLANLDAWAAGDVSHYTTAVKPAFGSGLAALKK